MSGDGRIVLGPDHPPGLKTMPELKITRDAAEAMRKTAAMKAMPRAVKKIITRWGAESVKDLKDRARNMQKSGRGRKTGPQARRNGMTIGASEQFFKTEVGTGVGGGITSKYARIQDEGGIIRKKDKMLTIPLPGVKGTIANYPGGFFIKSKAGNVLYVIPRFRKARGSAGSISDYSRSGGLKPLFILKDQVTIPPTRWFSNPMSYRLAILDGMLGEGNVLAEAKTTGEAGA
jgi:hypothetical protein